MKNFLKQIWQDERGALTTVEVIGYTVLIGGAVALVGFGATTLARGKMGDLTKDMATLKANSKVITGSSDYTGVGTASGKTGIVTSIEPTN